MNKLNHYQNYEQLNKNMPDSLKELNIYDFLSQMVIYFDRQIIKMNIKPLGKLKPKQQVRYMSGRLILQQITPTISKPSSLQRITTRRVIWSHNQKPTQQTQSVPKKIPSRIKLDAIKQTSNFSNNVESIQILKPTSRGSDSIRKTNSKVIATQQGEHPAVQHKLRIATVAFQRDQTPSERKIRNYVACFLPKGDQKELHIVEEANQKMSKITPFMWNVTVSLFTTLDSLIKNNSMVQAKKMGTSFIYMEEEVIQNQQQILSILDDPNHISIVCQCFYFERVICLILAVNFKLIELELNQLSWICQTIRRTLNIRNLMFEVVNEYQQNFLKYNKLKKPSHLIRQKKLISINKVLNEQREAFTKFIKFSTLKRFKFDIKNPLNHTQLINKTHQLKYQMLGMPIPPFLSLPQNDEFYLFCDPEGIFYTEDTKSACIQMKPETENILRRLSKLFNIIIFSRKKEKSIEPFLKQVNYIQFAGVLDRSHETYRQGRRIKDLDKFNLDLEKTRVLDINWEKYYPLHPKLCLDLNKNHTEQDLIDILRHFEGFIENKKQVRQLTIDQICRKRI